jgi:FlaA1/EpsC-like NDP-sugar epimerase
MKSIFYKKSVLVTGGTGLIGIQLVKKLFLEEEVGIFLKKYISL